MNKLTLLLISSVLSNCSICSGQIGGLKRSKDTACRLSAFSFNGNHGSHEKIIAGYDQEKRLVTLKAGETSVAKYLFTGNQIIEKHVYGQEDTVKVQHRLDHHRRIISSISEGYRLDYVYNNHGYLSEIKTSSPHFSSYNKTAKYTFTDGNLTQITESLLAQEDLHTTKLEISLSREQVQKLLQFFLLIKMIAWEILFRSAAIKVHLIKHQNLFILAIAVTKIFENPLSSPQIS